MESTVKQRIGKYEITGILGRGGMGVVYRAEDKRIGRRVAIKTLTEGFSGQPEMLERFYREAQAGILQHPNIVIVFDLGDEDGVPFIVMEFVEGDPLDKLIGSGRNISLIEKLSIIEQVCLGLGYAHRRGVVHRDIKPANVIVQPDGHAKIVDFGIARVQSSGVEGGLTRTGNVIGTIHYIAPERLKGQHFDGRSDIFATGVMLYLLLTGQLPFTGEDMTVLQKLVNEPHPPLTTYLQNYPPQLDAIVEKALCKDPDQRYATAEEFAADLHALADELKKGQITELYTDAERLVSQEQYGRAREVLLQLIRIDPQHAGARQLLNVVTQKLALLQRADQIRQLVAESEEAISAQRFPEAINSLEQALRHDPESAELKKRLADARDKKQRFDEISNLMTQADLLGQRGDWTGAAQVIEKALPLNPTDTKIRALHLEYSRQAKIAAQQGQIRGLLDKARQELSSRHYTAAIEILREVGKIDPSQAEMESLLQTAVSAQEQERRRTVIEQIHAKIEASIASEDYDSANSLAERAVQELPNEPSLQQLLSRVSLQAKKFRERQLISSIVAKAQELFLESPGEALRIVQKGLVELPGEERLLTLEDSLRQRLKAAEKEEVRGRYLREAQDAMGRSQFEKAIEILESYQLEFNDAEAVSELLGLARNELTQQQRRARTTSTVSKARALMSEERFDEAIRLLEPATAEIGDPSLARLLEEARAQRAEVERKAGAVMARIAKLRERGQLDEAIEALQALPQSQVSGSQPNRLLTEIRNEQARKQATSKALNSATQAIEEGNFQSAIEALESVQRAYGETPELARAIAEIETRRRELANEAVAKAVETARAALVANDAAGAIKELKTISDQVGYADAAQQSDWKRLGAEAAKPRKTGTVTQLDFDVASDDAPKKKMLVPLIGGGVLVAALAIGGYFVFHKTPPPPPIPDDSSKKIVEPSAPAATTGTLLVKANTQEMAVNVDSKTNTKGFTLPDGTATITLDPGSHTIYFAKPGFTECPQVTVTIKAGEQASVPCQTTPIKGAVIPPVTDAWITIHSNPNASVTLDGQAQGAIDAHGTLLVHIPQIGPGNHTISLTLSGFQNGTQEFTAKAGDRRDFTIGLNPVVVVPKAQVTALLSATPTIVEAGKPVTLSWRTANASDVVIDNNVGSVSANGDKIVNPTRETTYVLTAKGDGGTQTSQVTIAIAAAPPPPAPAARREEPVVQQPAPVDDGKLIQGALDRLVSAFNAHDSAAMRSAGMPANMVNGYQKYFKDHPATTVAIECSGAPAISGATATRPCALNMNSHDRAGGAKAPFTFYFSKQGESWTVKNMQ